MAHEIRSTPRLSGESAKRFAEKVREREMGSNPEKVKETHERLERSLDFFSRASRASTSHQAR